MEVSYAKVKPFFVIVNIFPAFVEVLEFHEHEVQAVRHQFVRAVLAQRVAGQDAAVGCEAKMPFLLVLNFCKKVGPGRFEAGFHPRPGLRSPLRDEKARYFSPVPSF